MLARLDNDLLQTLRTSERLHAAPIERIAIALGRAGNNGAVWFVLCGFLALVDEGNRESWLIAMWLGPIAIVVNFAIKKVVKRPRPVLKGHEPLGGAPSGLSFPSAHATSSFAVATMATRIEPAIGIPMLVLATAISLCRPYLGMHYPSDVVAGAIFGVAVGALIGLEL